MFSYDYDKVVALLNSQIKGRKKRSESVDEKLNDSDKGIDYLSQFHQNVNVTVVLQFHVLLLKRYSLESKIKFITLTKYQQRPNSASFLWNSLIILNMFFLLYT